ncbi:GNAT family N-acetyltransferase [Paenibacillus bovis]|uniref:GNAT family acetyltransferase n=1 Tax=Paenibacillus bovis TaxID=1616788 RepID=A0A172ZHI8_9BACL|nr:GNAT family N-acetyltransferase [Paenibacillus bovis]ANF97104.1 GNAT family acetyltransferase [Paenibacillus bovis]
MDNKVIVMPYQDTYQEQIVELIVDIQRNEYQIPITRADQPDLANIHEFYQQGKGNFWVALYGDKVVGTIALLDIGDRQTALRKMFVAADYRGSTYRTAQLLLEQASQWAEEHEVRQIYLGTTEQFKAAHRFYEKNKFVQIAIDQLPTRFPVMKVDTRFYCRDYNGPTA